MQFVGLLSSGGRYEFPPAAQAEMHAAAVRFMKQVQAAVKIASAVAESTSSQPQSTTKQQHDQMPSVESNQAFEHAMWQRIVDHGERALSTPWATAASQ